VKAVGCKGVIFAAFIDDADVSMGCRLLVSDHAVQLANLQGSWVSLVAKADRKLLSSPYPILHRSDDAMSGPSNEQARIWPAPEDAHDPEGGPAG
jgi:hypothetical protein